MYLLKSGLILGVVLGLYYLILSGEKLYRFNRAYLLAGLLIAFGLPFLTIPVYVEAEVSQTEIVAKAVEIPHTKLPDAVTEIQPQVVAQDTKQVVPSAAVRVNYLPYIIWGIYGVVTLLLAIRFGLNVNRFYTVARQNAKVRLQGATVVLLNDCPLPYTFMNFIFVSKHHYEGRAVEAELLTHELAHVKQRHTFDVLFAEVLKTVFWFNPLLYIYKKAIQTNHEFLADEAVVQEFDNIKTYQLLLLDKATPPLAYALASSINFNLTKKRFAMMTKTTTKLKGGLLQSAMLPVAAGLVYFFSIQTITYAKTSEGKTKPTISYSTPVEEFIPETLAAAIETDSPITDATEVATLTPLTDTLVGDARRDEYFKGVRIVIEDPKRGVSVNAPYEKVSLEHKRYYLNDVPEKKKAKPITEEDYKFTMGQEPATFFINEREVTKEEVLKYKREDFVYSGFKANGFSEPGGKLVQHFQMFLYTYPYFEKKVKHINDHYPAKLYTIKITAQPVDKTKDEFAGLSAKNVDNKKPETNEYKVVNGYATYDFAADAVERNKNASQQFPGGHDEFEKYVLASLKLPEEVKRKELWVLFAVNTDGSISDVTVRNGDEATQKEVNRVLTASPRWIPAQKDGEACKVFTSLILFGKKN